MGPDPCVVNKVEKVRCEQVGRSRGTYLRADCRSGTGLTGLVKVLDFSLETAKSQGC